MHIKKSAFDILFVLILISMVMPQSNDINLSITLGTAIPFKPLSPEGNKMYVLGGSENPAGKIPLPIALLFFKYVGFRL